MALIVAFVKNGRVEKGLLLFFSLSFAAECIRYMLFGYALLKYSVLKCPLSVNFRGKKPREPGRNRKSLSRSQAKKKKKKKGIKKD